MLRYNVYIIQRTVRRIVFRAFVKVCTKLKLYQKELLAIDGSKIRAVNSKNYCYNAKALEKKIANIDEHISEYLSMMDSLEIVADKGYESREDIMNCIMNGVVPNVAMKYDRKERLYNIEYKEAEITNEIRYSKKPEDMGLSFLAYNMIRAINMVGIEKLLAIM